MNIVLAIAGVVIKEMYRRKDFYVLFVLTALITLLSGSVTFFGDDKIAKYVKEICLLMIWVSSLVIAIGPAARQIPAERENRTIFPLLAKPVTRGRLIVGKFLGCWAVAGFALLVLYLFLAVISGLREDQWSLAHFTQALLLHWSMLAIVIGMVLLGSVVLSAPSVNWTVTLIIVIGILFMGEHLNKVAGRMAAPAGPILSAIYYLIPHLEWYDIRDLVIYKQKLVPAWALGLALIYAAVYTTGFLCATWFVFRRKPLSA
jgi:ABC-type transport system involved in multi-copper enzyme maturation permease subunit